MFCCLTYILVINICIDMLLCLRMLVGMKVVTLVYVGNKILMYLRSGVYVKRTVQDICVDV